MAWTRADYLCCPRMLRLLQNVWKMSQKPCAGSAMGWRADFRFAMKSCLDFVLSHQGSGLRAASNADRWGATVKRIKERKFAQEYNGLCMQADFDLRHPIQEASSKGVHSEIYLLNFIDCCRLCDEAPHSDS